jgi:hypothetical protein
VLLHDAVYMIAIVAEVDDILYEILIHVLVGEYADDFTSKLAAHFPHVFLANINFLPSGSASRLLVNMALICLGGRPDPSPST